MKNYVPEIHIIQKGGELFTTSIDVAEKFGKRHDTVLRSVRNILAELPERGARNFAETYYTDESNRRQPMFNITRSGFSVLVMGFTGKKAIEWKFLYEEAFSKMETALLNQKNLSWQNNRAVGKLGRKEETATIKDFVEYARAQGSTKAEFYYKHLTNATYKALFIIKDKFPGSFRDMLDAMQLSYLAAAEYVAANAINEGMAQSLYYKDIYLLAKSKLEKFAESVGVTPVITTTRQPMLPMSTQRIAGARV